MAEGLKETGFYVGIDLGVSCVVACSPVEDRYAITVSTNDVSGRSTPGAVSYDGKLRHVGMNAEGRAMSAPKQTFTHLALLLGGAEAIQQRANRYTWLFPHQEDGTLGPICFDGEEFSVDACGPLGALLSTLASFATGKSQTRELCIAVHDFFSDEEVAVVRDALEINGMQASLVRHSDAAAAAFVQNCGKKLLPEGTESRTVAFVDMGVAHCTVSVVRFSRPSAEVAPGETGPEAVAEATAEFLFRRCDETIGVQAFVNSLISELKSRIEQKHKCTVQMRSKSGARLYNEAVHVMKQLSMLPDGDFNLEAFLPEGPDGPEIDVSLALTRDIFEAAAAEPLQRLKAVLAEALAFAGSSLESVEVIGGGSRIPAVQAMIKTIAGESVPVRSGLDGASAIATGAAAWAAGRKVVPAMPTSTGLGLSPEALAAAKNREARIEATHVEEVQRLEKRNALESYVYQVRGWLHGKDGALLRPDIMNPFLDKVVLWFEDADMAEEPTSFQDYADKLKEAEDFVKQEGAAFFEKQAKEREESEKALERAAEEERKRRQELGMDFDKDDRHMKKEDRLRLAVKNKDEGNDMFKAQKFDDALRRYKKAIEHVCRPEVVSNMSPDEAEEAKKIKVSCHLNSAQCYIKAAETAFETGGKNGAEPFYKKAKTSADDVLSLDEQNVKALFRRSLCWEKLGELESATKDIKKGLDVDPENADLKKSKDRLEKLLLKQKEGQKKVFAKMFG